MGPNEFKIKKNLVKKFVKLFLRDSAVSMILLSVTLPYQ